MSRSDFYYHYDGFDTFIRLIKYANTTFQRTVKEKDGEQQEKDEVKFNYTKGFSDFRDSLYRKLEEVKREIVSDIISQHSRFEKLVFIASKVAELENAMNKLTKVGGKFLHEEFSFSNISKEEGTDIVMTENDVQDFYEVMQKYSQELLKHLKIVEQSVNSSVNGDFPILIPTPPDPNEPSIQKPLAFFEYFIVARGFTKFHKDFFPTDEEEYYNISSIDKEKEIITYEDYDHETGEPYSYTRDFKQKLLDKLYLEFLQAKKSMDGRIDEFSDEADINLFLKILLYRIKHIHSSLQKYPEALKYDSNTHVLKALIKFIFDKYEPFVKEHEAVDFFKQIITPAQEQPAVGTPLPVTQKMLPQREVILAFKWVTNIHERTIKLHQALVEGGFIAKTIDVSDFSKAFHGEAIEHPLNIRWLKKVKGKLSKPLILYLFDQLMESGLLEKVSANQEIYKKVQRIFTDHDGNPLQHLDVSSAGIKQRKKDYTEAEKQINVIIASLKS